MAPIQRTTRLIHVVRALLALRDGDRDGERIAIICRPRGLSVNDVYVVLRTLEDAQLIRGRWKGQQRIYAISDRRKLQELLRH